MNKDYAYVNGKVIISDENGNKKIVSDYNGLETALILENIIETINANIEEIEKDIEYYKKNEKKKFVPKAFIFSMIFIIIAPFLNFILTRGVSLMDIFNTKDYFTIVANQLVTLLGLCVPVGVITIFIEHSIFDHTKKTLEGLKSEHEFLVNQLEIEKQKLDYYKLEDEKPLMSKQIDDEEQLANLDDYLDLYYTMGHDKKELYEYYRKGKLDELLSPYYNDTGIKLVEEHLKADEKKLVRKK